MCFVNQYTLEHPIVIVNDNGEFIENDIKHLETIISYIKSEGFNNIGF